MEIWDAYFPDGTPAGCDLVLSLIHISEPTRLRRISFAVVGV